MSSWRAWLAAAGCGGIAAALLVLDAAAGGDPSRLIRHADLVPAELMLGLIAATATLAVAATAPRLAARAALPVALGPLLAGLVLLGRQLSWMPHFGAQDWPGQGYLGHALGQQDSPVSETLLVVAAVTIAAPDAITRLRLRVRRRAPEESSNSPR